MRHHKALCLTMVIGMFLMAAVAFGQSTTGSLSGTVFAQDGDSALPGAQMTAVHEPTGTRYTSITDASGRFRILNVRVGGPYTVSAAMDSFRMQEKGDVFVKLGEDTYLTFGMQLDTVTETLTVVSESSLINPSRMGSTSSVSSEAIQSLPTISRNLNDFARTNPFFTVGSENEDPDAISVAGRNSRYNNITIDGSVNNDLFGLSDSGTPGGQAGTTPISLDAIQELQLVLTPFDVRQGGFSGGGINAVTRSGSNKLAGSVFYFTRDDSNVGDGPDQLGDFGEFSEDQYGFRLGGPIKQDKAFFFLNADIEERTTPTGFSIDGSSGQAFGFVPEAQAFRQSLIDRYGYDPGGLGQQSKDNPSDKIFARVDFNLNDSHQLTVRHNYVDAGNDINRPNQFTYEFPSETYDFQTETNSTVAALNSVFGNDKFNEFRFAFQTIKDRRAGVGEPFPWIEIENVQPGNRREFEAGTEPFSTFNALDQDIIEIHNDFTWLKGDHTITIGTHNELFTFDNLFVQNGFGSYEFANLSDFLADNPTARRYQRQFANPGQNPVATFDVSQLGFYIGDQWAAADNLSLTFGLRVDIPLFPDSPTRNPVTENLYGFRTDVIPDGNEMISPRFGFNWDPEGNGKGQLRGGLGIFSGRTPFVWVSNQFTNNGIVFTNLQAFGVEFNPDPFNQPGIDDLPSAGASTQEVNLIDPDFEFPQVLRISLAYDRELPWWGLVGSIEMVFSDSRKEIDYRNLNIVQTGETTFDGRPIYTNVSSDFSGAYLITNTGEGEATNIAIKIEKPYRNGLWGYISYANADSTVVNEGTSSRAVSNWQFQEAIDPNDAGASHSDFEVEHRFNASASYQFNRDGRWPTTVSAFYNLQSGRPYSNIFGFSFPSINQDRFGNNDLVFVPASANDVIITNGTWEQLDAFIRSDSGMDAARGGIQGRNTSEAPWNHSLDLHIAQEIPTGGRSHLELTFDIVNLMNLIDKNSGVLRYANFNTITPYNFEGIDEATGKPIISLDDIVLDGDPGARWTLHNINSRYRLRLGVRWSF